MIEREAYVRAASGWLLYQFQRDALTEGDLTAEAIVEYRNTPAFQRLETQYNTTGFNDTAWRRLAQDIAKMVDQRRRLQR